jgi:hypothetical protein
VEADKGFVKGDSMAVDGVNEGTTALSLNLVLFTIFTFVNTWFYNEPSCLLLARCTSE